MVRAAAVAAPAGQHPGSSSGSGGSGSGSGSGGMMRVAHARAVGNSTAGMQPRYV
jgi:hypothetical protein